MENKHLTYMIVKLLADDQNTIPYRPPIARVYREHYDRGAIPAAIFLQQTVYWWSKEWTNHPSFTPFFKDNQSWIDDLQMSIREFFNARRNTGIKKKQSVPMAQVKTLALTPADDGLSKPVLYWTTKDHKTYYNIHVPSLLHILALAYPREEVKLLLNHETLISNTSEITERDDLNHVSLSPKSRYVNSEITLRDLEDRDYNRDYTETTREQQHVLVVEALSKFGVIEPALSNPAILNQPHSDVQAWIWYAQHQGNLDNPQGLVVRRLQRGKNAPLSFRLLAELPAGALAWLKEHSHRLPYRESQFETPLDFPAGLDAELANLWFEIQQKGQKGRD